jgi:hypothetical protein
MRQTFARQRPGAAIEARTINRPIGALEQFSGLRVAAPLSLQWVNGSPHIALAQGAVLWARIVTVGAAGKYAWQGIASAAAGTWADLPSNVSGTLTADPCYEANGNATLAVGARVQIARDAATGEWRFQSGSC